MKLVGKEEIRMHFLFMFFYLTNFAISLVGQEEKAFRNVEVIGWAGSPSSPEQEPFDYFYIKSHFSLQRNKLIKEENQLKACSETAKYTDLADIISRIIVSSVGEGSSHEIFSNSPYQKLTISLRNKFSASRAEVKQCKIIKSSRMECECTTYLKYEGGQEAVLKEFQKIDSN